MKQYADLNLYTHSHNEQTDTRGLSQYSQDTAPKKATHKRLHKTDYTYQILDIDGLILNPMCNEIIELMNQSYTDSKAYSDHDGQIILSSNGVMPSMSDVFNSDNNDDTQGDSFKDNPSFNRNDGDILDQLYAPCEFDKMTFHYSYYIKNLQRWRTHTNGKPNYTPNAPKMAIKQEVKRKVAVARMAVDARYKANMSYKRDMLNIALKNVSQSSRPNVSYKGSEFPAVRIATTRPLTGEYCNTVIDEPIDYGTVSGCAQEFGYSSNETLPHRKRVKRATGNPHRYQSFRYARIWYVSPKSLDDGIHAYNYY